MKISIFRTMMAGTFAGLFAFFSSAMLVTELSWGFPRTIDVTTSIFLHITSIVFFLIPAMWFLSLDDEYIADEIQYFAKH